MSTPTGERSGLVKLSQATDHGAASSRGLAWPPAPSKRLLLPDPWPERIGRYRVERRLGQGGMGTVYRALDEHLQRPVAIKVLDRPPRGTLPGAEMERFWREARVLAALQHPHIVRLYEFVPPEGERPAYLVMEFIEGRSLRSLLEAGGPLPGEVVAMLGCRLAAALHVAHEQGVIHRDLKPDNVLIEPSGRVVLLDFGLAALARGTSITGDGYLMGTAAFASPEQFQRRVGGIDARSDLYSLGVALYQLATGELPYSRIERFGAEVGTYVDPMAFEPRLPRYLAREVETCLNKDPAARGDDLSLAQGLKQGLHADHLYSFEDELAEFLREPDAYRERLGFRMVQRSLAQAKELLKGATQGSGAELEAQHLLYRVLAWQPEQVEAKALVARIERRWERALGGRWRGWPVRAVAMMGLVALVIAGAFLGMRRTPAGAGSSTAPGKGGGTAPAHGESKNDRHGVSLEKPSGETDMKKLGQVARGVAVVAGMSTMSASPAAHAKPPQMCQADSDCKKKEACKSAGSLGNWCAEYDPKGCSPSNYRFSKRSPERVRGKCWLEGTPDGSDTGRFY
jgi:serine/threonine-protein kinase